MTTKKIKKTWGGQRAGAGAKIGTPSKGGRPPNPATEKLKAVTVKESLAKKFKELTIENDLTNSQMMQKLLNLHN
jgi:hypothetical protein